MPAGPFTMGAGPARDPLAFDNERWSAAAGEGTVDLPAFFIARTKSPSGSSPRLPQRAKWTVSPQALAGPPSHPVTFVSWPEALAYCRWLETTLQAIVRRARRP